MDAETQALKDQVQLLAAIISSQLMRTEHINAAHDQLAAAIAKLPPDRAEPLRTWAQGLLPKPAGVMGMTGSFPGL